MKIKAVRITLDRAEGLTSECGPKPPVTTFAEANALLRRMAHTAPPKGRGYDKTDFKIEFADGQVYEGRIDLQCDVYETIEEHVLQFCRFYSGRMTAAELPSHLTMDRYKMVVGRYSDSDRASAAEWLDKYQFGDAEEKAHAAG